MLHVAGLQLYVIVEPWKHSTDVVFEFLSVWVKSCNVHFGQLYISKKKVFVHMPVSKKLWVSNLLELP